MTPPLRTLRTQLSAVLAVLTPVQITVVRIFTESTPIVTQ